MISFPGLSSVQRTANKNSIARRVMSPVVESAELIERDIADDGVALGIVGYGDIAGNAIVGRLHSAGRLPVMTSIHGIGSMRIVLEHGHNLLWISLFHGDSRLRKLTRLPPRSRDN